jgi:hypothetical protein
MLKKKVFITASLLVILLVGILYVKYPKGKKSHSIILDKSELFLGLTLGGGYRKEVLDFYSKTNKTFTYTPFRSHSHIQGCVKPMLDLKNGDTILIGVKIYYNDKYNFVFFNPLELENITSQDFFNYQYCAVLKLGIISKNDKKYIENLFKKKYGKIKKSFNRFLKIENSCVNAIAPTRIHHWETDSMDIMFEFFKTNDVLGKPGYNLVSTYQLRKEILNKNQKTNF